MRQLGEPTEITIHHSASPLKTTVADITKWHTNPKPKGNGWPHVGYHYIITSDGRIHATFPVHRIGYHCRPNKGRIGICVVGNNLTKRLQWKWEQELQLRVLVSSLVTVFPTIKLIRGHRDTGAATECPGCDIEWDGLLTVRGLGGPPR